MHRIGSSPLRTNPTSEGHIPHSQHPSPKSTLFFPSRTALRPNTPFSHIFVTTKHSVAYHSKDPFCSPHALFSLAVRHLSPLETCPFAPPSLTFRPSISYLSPLDTCLTPQSTLSIRHSKRPKPPFTPSISPEIPTQDLYQNSQQATTAFVFVKLCLPCRQVTFRAI